MGGLCLAQGLKGARAEVVVYEGDNSLNARRQGYRLHVDARAGLALHRCLPPELFASFLATCGQPSTCFTVMNERLRLLHETRSDPARDPLDPSTLSTSVNRQTLREILAIDRDDRLHFSRALVGYEEGDEIGLTFEDGTRAAADVLVGADGVSSVVRRQRLPDARITDTGGRCIYGKTTLDDSLIGRVPRSLQSGFTAIVGGDLGMATGLVRFRERPERVDARLSPARDYLMWAVSGRVDAFGRSDPGMSVMSAAGLHQLAGRLIAGWHPDLRALVARAEPNETSSSAYAHPRRSTGGQPHASRCWATRSTR